MGLISEYVEMTYLKDGYVKTEYHDKIIYAKHILFGVQVYDPYNAFDELCDMAYVYIEVDGKQYSGLCTFKGEHKFQVDMATTGTWVGRRGY